MNKVLETLQQIDKALAMVEVKGDSVFALTSARTMLNEVYKQLNETNEE